MLKIVKYNDEIKIEYCSKFSNLLLKEYYINILENDKIKELFKFNEQKIISREIKNKNSIYYVIQYKDEIIGYVLLEKQNEKLNISQLFILKRYRKSGFSKEVIKEIKNIAANNHFKNININIEENKKAIRKIIEKLGFKETQTCARYIGDDIYIYDREYCLQL